MELRTKHKHKLSANYATIIIFWIFFLLALFTIEKSHPLGLEPNTGDEPLYLIASQSMVKDFDLELIDDYAEGISLFPYSIFQLPGPPLKALMGSVQ